MKCKVMNAKKEELMSVCEALGMRGKMELGPIIDTVSGILSDIRTRKDEAVFEYTKRFDKADINAQNVRVTEKEIADAMASIDPKLISIIQEAKNNIMAFHEKQREDGFVMQVGKGSEIGMRVRPISVAGVYVPGGTAPLPSTVLMNVIPAKAAGVPRVVLCTPPRADGTIAPVILAAASIAGADEIYKVGGAQAIVAMACGTPSIPRVDKICGPGNIYVNTAKRLVYGMVDIDMFAGPSEILIIADESANAEFVAADMLSQAEHDVLASAILLTTSSALAAKVEEAVDRRSEKSLRKSILEKSLANYCAIIVVDDLDTALAFSEELAPEHIELCVNEPDVLLQQLKNAGAVFVGNYTPEPLGDYFAGPNHTLPTSGTARFFSPLNTGDFVKKMSVLRYTEEDLKGCYQSVAGFADAEGLECHASAVRVRFEE
ncbi:MAG TPA: histidinol dehydrogenase [Bacillota bacterium]|nr:histidinol dehydrogenase [Bacillota bacterium]HPE38620.1 histidinol dehydrogenase [Bacillota bacterium]